MPGQTVLKIARQSRAETFHTSQEPPRIPYYASHDRAAQAKPDGSNIAGIQIDPEGFIGWRAPRTISFSG